MTDHAIQMEELDTLSQLPMDGEQDGKKSSISSASKDVEKIELQSKDSKEKAFAGEIDVVDPVISTGEDVSKYMVPLTDAGDPATTFRGIFIGILILLLQSLVTQVYSAKPVSLSLSSVFIILLCWMLLRAWAAIMPRASWVEGGRFESWAPFLRLINPGPIGVKEHVVSSILASSGMNGAAGTDVLATIKLFYGGAITPVMVIFGLFSITMIGVGLVGLLRPIIIYPSEMVYWSTLPMVAVYNMLHHEKGKDQQRIKAFCILFAVTFLYEPLVAYVAPIGNGISIFCIASMGAPMKIRKHIARIFGGASSNQGLGLLSLSFDPQYVSPSNFAGFPLKWQVNYWLGSLTGAMFMLALFYGNAFHAKTFPFMSASLFLPNGTVYPLDDIFDENFHLVESGLETYGLPRLTTTAIWSYFCQTMAIGALVVHVTLFYRKDVWRYFKEGIAGTQHDPHYIAMQQKGYKEVPHSWYAVLGLLAVIGAFLTVTLSKSSLSWWGLVVALVVGCTITPFSSILYGSYGSSIATNMLSKMVAGAVHGGRPVANLWFANYCHQIVNIVVSLSDYMKIGQYLKIPWRTMFMIQIGGGLIGAYFNWWVISIIIHNKRDILLDPIGNNQWSGILYQSINSQAVEWALASRVFKAGSGLGYEIVPLGILVGGCVPPIHWLAKKYIKKVREVGDLITTPLTLYYLQELSGGLNSPLTSCILMGIFMQAWLRVKKPRIFREYCYLLSAAIDGAAQIMVLILSFFVFGGTGTPHPFPTWFGNPDGSPDHCVSTRTYN